MGSEMLIRGRSILGDATIEKTLEEAGIHEAAGIVVCLNNDPDNLFVTLTARSLNHDAFLVSRCSQINNKPKLKQAGADKVVNPIQLEVIAWLNC